MIIDDKMSLLQIHNPKVQSRLQVSPQEPQFLQISFSFHKGLLPKLHCYIYSCLVCNFERVSQLLSFKDLGCAGINFGI
nr:hypothetical protein CFP56_05064 [Quercus suber]